MEQCREVTDECLHAYSPLSASAAAAAKSLPSCPTLRDPIHGSPPGPRPWDSPGKNTGVGCHFLLQCMEVKSEREVAQSCPTLSDPMDCSPPGSSAHGIFQAGGLEWVPLPSPCCQPAKFKPQLRSHCFITLSKEVRLFAPFLSHM